MKPVNKKRAKNNIKIFEISLFLSSETRTFMGRKISIMNFKFSALFPTPIPNFQQIKVAITKYPERKIQTNNKYP